MLRTFRSYLKHKHHLYPDDCWCVPCPELDVDVLLLTYLCICLHDTSGFDRAVHSSLFSADGLRIMTGSDDGTVKSWDLATGKQVFSLKGATDYIRAQAASPASKHIWATGSYDRHARIYDLRTRNILFTLDHGSQVDKVILLPGGARAITIGGPEVKVWDFFAGGRMVVNLRNHAKAVTCGALSSSGDRLLTGGLDGQVKVHDASSFDLITSMSFDAQVLALAVSPQGNRIAVGLVDGTVDIRARKADLVTPASIPNGSSDEPALLPQQQGALKERLFEGWGRGFEKPKRKGPNPGSLRYYLRGEREGPTDSRDVIVAKRRRTRLKTHDVLLRKFAYGEALDAALAGRSVKVAASVLEELIARDGLRAALAGRDALGLRPVLSLVSKRVNDAAYAPLLTRVAETIIDVYADVLGRESGPDSIDSWLRKILSSVKREVAVIRELCNLQGMLSVVGSSIQAAGN
jgi:U3 small nucleolar RNA-associated protein 15